VVVPVGEEGKEWKRKEGWTVRDVRMKEKARKREGWAVWDKDGTEVVLGATRRKKRREEGNRKRTPKIKERELKAQRGEEKKRN